MTAGRSIKDACDLRAHLLDRSCREAFAGAISARTEDLQGDGQRGSVLQREALDRIGNSRADGLSDEQWRVRWSGNLVDQNRLIVMLHSHVSRQASSDFSVWPTFAELDEFISSLDRGMTSHRKTFVNILPPRES